MLQLGYPKPAVQICINLQYFMVLYTQQTHMWQAAKPQCVMPRELRPKKHICAE
jgi:hypothetical protein